MTYAEALETVNNGGGYILSNQIKYEYAMYTARKALRNRIGEETGGETGRKADPNIMSYKEALHELKHANLMFLKTDVRRRYYEAKEKAEDALRIEVEREKAEKERAAAVEEKVRHSEKEKCGSSTGGNTK